MRDDCITNLETLGSHADAYPASGAIRYVLPNLARPGLFGD